MAAKKAKKHAVANPALAKAMHGLRSSSAARAAVVSSRSAPRSP